MKNWERMTSGESYSELSGLPGIVQIARGEYESIRRVDCWASRRR